VHEFVKTSLRVHHK